MGQMFGGGSQRSREQQAQGFQPTPRTRMSFDLLQNALLSNLMHPPAMNIPAPMGEAIAGMQNMMPALTASAFGPGSGLAGMGIPPPSGPGTGPGGVPSTPTANAPVDWRQIFGMNAPTSDPAGFLPPTADVKANLPRVRVPHEAARDRNLQRRLAAQEATLAGRQAAGTGRPGNPIIRKKIAQTQRRIDRERNNPKFLEPSIGSPQ